MDGKTIMEAVMEAAYDAKMDKITMRKLELLALPEIKTLTPEQIRTLRESAKSIDRRRRLCGSTRSTCRLQGSP